MHASIFSHTPSITRAGSLVNVRVKSGQDRPREEICGSADHFQQFRNDYSRERVIQYWKWMENFLLLCILYKLPQCILELTNACIEKIHVKCDDCDTIPLEMHQTNLLPDVWFVSCWHLWTLLEMFTRIHLNSVPTGKGSTWQHMRWLSKQWEYIMRKWFDVSFLLLILLQRWI